MFEDQRLLSGLRAQDKDALRRIYEKYIDDLLISLPVRNASQAQTRRLQRFVRRFFVAFMPPR